MRDVLFPLELKIAAVVDDLLITHAGVTQDWADERLEQTDDIHAIAHDLNAMLEEGAYDLRPWSRWERHTEPALGGPCRTDLRPAAEHTPDRRPHPRGLLLEGSLRHARRRT